MTTTPAGPGEPKAPKAVRWITQTLEAKGYETWAVGGAVRDALAGVRGGDWDLATRARPEEVRRTFPRTVPIGVDHGTVGVLTADNVMFEVTTFRRDVETFGRHAVVEFAEDLDEDLARRDFTINAIAWHPIREEMRDPFDGVADLTSRKLRTVGDPAARFAEDYLRVLRALRFAGRFGMTVQAETWSALCAARSNLNVLSPERIREELTKVLSLHERPSRSLALYGAAGVLGELYPELDRLVGFHEDASSVDAWARSLMMVDTVAGGRSLGRLASLLHAVGMPVAGAIQCPSRRERGTLRTAAVMERLRFSRAATEKVASAVGAASVPPEWGDPPAALRRWLSSIRRSDLRDIVRVWIAGARVDDVVRGAGRTAGEGATGLVLERVKALRTELATHPPLAVSDLAVDGRNLIAMGLRPGPHFGEILGHLLDIVLEDPSRNEPVGLANAVTDYLEGGSGSGH